MLKAHPILHGHMDHLADLYEQFRAEAQPKYGWDHEPVPFEQLQIAIQHKILRGYWVEDTSVSHPVALMLYCLEEHRAIEINAIYIPQKADGQAPERKTITDRLMRTFIKDLREDASLLQAFDVISYALLGEQSILIRTLLWYGFKPVGQAIVQYNIMDPITLQIMKQQQLPALPEGYRLGYWEPQFAGGVAQVVFEAFASASDSLWDPRFRTELGARKVVGMITQGLMGTHRDECTSVLLKDNEPVGFCFLIQTAMKTGNIPLIAVLPSEKKKSFGNHLLKHTLEGAIENILAGKMGMLTIDATHDTDNISAIKMYRRMGFRETQNYPHLYMPKEKLLSLDLGRWC